MMLKLGRLFKHNYLVYTNIYTANIYNTLKSDKTLRNISKKKLTIQNVYLTLQQDGTTV